MKYMFLWLSCVILIGCDPDFPERYQVEGYRVLGAVANPPAVGPEDAFSIELVEANGDDATYRWSVCLINLGSNFEFQCLDESLEIPLESEASSIQVDLGPDGVNFLERLFTALALLETTDDSDEDKMGCGEACQTRDGEETTYLDLVFRIESGPLTGRKVTTIKSVRVHFDDAPRNENPDMLSLVLADPSPVAAGAEVKIEYAIDTTRLEGYELANGAKIDETHTVNWYTTAGEFRDEPNNTDKTTDLTTHNETEIYLKLPDEILEDSVTVWAVVRDERGGTDWGTLTFDVRP